MRISTLTAYPFFLEKLKEEAGEGEIDGLYLVVPDTSSIKVKKRLAKKGWTSSDWFFYPPKEKYILGTTLTGYPGDVIVKRGWSEETKRTGKFFRICPTTKYEVMEVNGGHGLLTGNGVVLLPEDVWEWMKDELE